MKKKKLVLVDGHAMVHRAFHAVADTLSTSSGEPVNATYGFTSMLMMALLEEKPEYIAMTFDRPTPTFRHEEYTPYKAHRPTLPDNMRPQFARIREVVQAFGIPIYEKDGYEADDVLGTLSVQAAQQGVFTIIYTGDMDTLQLVNENVMVKVAKRGITEVTEYDEPAVEIRYGLPPEKLPEWKGLVGDKSDNIPGVAGIGEKTATRLISEYGDIEGVLAHVNDLKPKEQKLLQNAADIALLSKHLATIVRDVPVQLDLEACRVHEVNTEKVLSLFRELGFRSLVERALNLFKALGMTNVSVEGETALAEFSAANATTGWRGENAQNGGNKQRDTSIYAQDETLLTSQPIGMVPIMEPPLPPAADTDVTPISATALAVNNDEQQQGQQELQEQAEGEGPLQLSLFDLPAPVTETVHRLRLPSNEAGGAPLFLEDSAQPQTNTMVVNTEEALQVLLQSIYAAGAAAFDTETTSDEPRHAELVGISCAMAPHEAYYIPVGHTQTPEGDEPERQLPLQYVLDTLAPMLSDIRVRKYMHNAKYDILTFARYNVIVKGLAFDTMVGAYLAEPGRRGVGLKEQAFQRLGVVMTPITELIGRGKKMISMSQVPIRTAANYAGADADMTLRLVEPILADLREHGLLELYDRIEQPLIPVLLQMERYGVALDAEFLRQLEVRLGEQLLALEQAIYDSVGHEFNINSTKQLGEVLFSELKLPAGKKTATGYSVSVDVIENLRGRHPMIDHLLEYRQLNKLKSTYVDGLLALMDTQTGRVYTSFNQTIASSGRLSSSNPNLQNIPIRTEVGRQIRRAFVADPSYMLLTADYSQFELRILASITDEPRLIEAFSKDEDIHTITAASLFNVPVEQVTKDQRRLAKTVVYAVLYGQSAFGLSQVTGMTNKESADFISRYHETFPNVKIYVDSTLNQARKQGFVNTMFGRKRFIPEMHVLSHNERQALEREAINMPIQGSNADLIKIAMINLHYTLKEQRMKTRMILQVHDELVFEVPVEELTHARQVIKKEMEGVGANELTVPIKVEMKVGKNWYEAEPME